VARKKRERRWTVKGGKTLTSSFKNQVAVVVDKKNAIFAKKDGEWGTLMDATRLRNVVLKAPGGGLDSGGGGIL